MSLRSSAQIDHQLRDNGYWIAALAKAQSAPERLERIRQKKALMQSITASDIQKLAQKYLQPGDLQKVQIVSSKVTTTAAR